MSKKSTSEPVQIDVSGHNMPVTEPLRTYVLGKMDRLTRYLDRLPRIVVILSAENSREAAGRNVAEATATVKGRTIRAESSDADMYAAIDGLVDKLHLQLTRTKERTRDHKRHGRNLEDAGEVIAIEPDDTEAGEGEGVGEDDLIVDVKQYTMKPMFSDEAIDEMNELGHAFFVFLNARTEKVSVVYRRHDGLYRLIEPAFA